MSTGSNSPPTNDELVLHVWPGKWNLPSINQECLAVILFAQLVIPGRFVVEECTNPDLSPDGHLPYLTHGLAVKSSYACITKYISHMPGGQDPSGHLSGVQSAQETAWLAFAQTHLGDLVACSFFTLKDNYQKCFRSVLADMFPVPQKYIVPDRLRNLYKSRLEKIGLWDVGREEKEEEKNPRPSPRSVLSESAAAVFGKEKVLETARTHLDILANLLGDRTYFIGDKPTSLDTLIAAHVLLLVVPDLPDALLRELITSDYPSIDRHAKRMRSFIHGESSPSSSQSILTSSPYASEFDLRNAGSRPRSTSITPLTVRTAPHASKTALTSLFSTSLSAVFSKPKVEKSDEEKEYDKLRWGWYALAVASVFAWSIMTGLRVAIVLSEDEKEQETKRKINTEAEEEEEENEESAIDEDED